MKRTFLICFAIIFFIETNNLLADPGNYYSGIDTNTSCANFKTILYNLIKNDHHLTYGSIDNNYNRTDLKPAEAPLSGYVIVERYCADIPTAFDSCNFRFDDSLSGAPSFCFTGGTFNYFCACYAKEHVLPKAWFNGTTTFSANEYTDITYIWPADSKMNNAKSNYPIGYVSAANLISYNNTKVGTSNSSLNYGYNNSLVFEPNDAFKGDFARAYLYFVTRYQDSVPAFRRNNIAVDVFSSTIYPGLQPWILQLCVKWHKQDPPDDFERKRNDSVYAIQGNRNPYIDYPHWVEKAFGTDGNSAACTTTAVKNNTSINYAVFPNPMNDVLNITIGGALSDKQAVLEITNILGQKKLSQIINPINNSIQVDTKYWEKGCYFVNIIYDGNNSVQQIVKL